MTTFSQSLTVVKIEHPPYGVNSYVVWDEATKDAFLVDIGHCIQPVLGVITANALNCEMLFHTHAFLDTMLGQPALRDEMNLLAHLNPMDEFWLAHMDTQSMVLGIADIPQAFVDQQVREGDVIQVGSIKVKVLETPGCTPGSVSYYVEEAGLLFVGDVIYKGSLGPTDIPYANTERLIETVKNRIFTLPDAVRLLPTRGDETTVGAEKATNTLTPTKYGQFVTRPARV
ncbi:MAG: MBL fold metallo-hydrolase [Vampirovibrionales bacterium]|nr:MBL fold metallo-hydrolase [Vampirovibrionales bacterium]